jgi:hypothetical protein
MAGEYANWNTPHDALLNAINQGGPYGSPGYAQNGSPGYVDYGPGYTSPPVTSQGLTRAYNGARLNQLSGTLSASDEQTQLALLDTTHDHLLYKFAALMPFNDMAAVIGMSESNKWEVQGTSAFKPIVDEIHTVFATLDGESTRCGLVVFKAAVPSGQVTAVERSVHSALMNFVIDGTKLDADTADPNSSFVYEYPDDMKVATSEASTDRDKYHKLIDGFGSLVRNRSSLNFLENTVCGVRKNSEMLAQRTTSSTYGYQGHECIQVIPLKYTRVQSGKTSNREPVEEVKDGEVSPYLRQLIEGK